MAGKLLLPNAASGLAGARLDPIAIREALDLMEVKHDVQIKWSGGYSRRGAHRFYDGKNLHVITVSTHLMADQASNTLWHEITHAAQTERYENGKVFHAHYVKENRTRGYKRNRFEVEASENGDAFGTDHPLATQVARRTVKEVPKW